jgi:hypothetical protein
MSVARHGIGIVDPAHQLGRRRHLIAVVEVERHDHAPQV